MTLGERIALKREEKGFSQRELARIAGLSHAQVSDLERGRRRTAGLDVAKKIARALGVSIDWLAGNLEADDKVADRPVPKVRPGRRSSRVS